MKHLLKHLLLLCLLFMLGIGARAIPNNTIYYTTSDGQVCSPFNVGEDIFGANIISNTYENGQGIITFDNGPTSIGEKAFYGCSGLTSINIPTSVTNIGSSAFYNCNYEV